MGPCGTEAFQKCDFDLCNHVGSRPCRPSTEKQNGSIDVEYSAADPTRPATVLSFQVHQSLGQP